MSEWEISLRDGRGNLRHVRFFGITTEEEARQAAEKFSDRWGGSEIETVEQVSQSGAASLTGVVTPP